MRHFDLAILAVALVVFLLADLPLLGYGAAAVAWLAQRAVRSLITRRAEASNEPRTVAMLLTVSMIARAWLMALVVFGAGMIDRQAGLAGAVLVIVLFTAFFSAQLALRPYDTKGSP